MKRKANIPKKIINIRKKKSSFEIIEIYPKIFHMIYENDIEMCTAFCRFQEYYESPYFKGKIFSLEEFASWYNTKYDRKKFTYHDDWSGFNIPSYVLKPFYNKKFKNISVQEKQILKEFNKVKGRFYIIATPKGYSKEETEEVIKHEIAHGLYYINKEYRKEVDNILNARLLEKDRIAFKEVLEKFNYHNKVHQDETHAYILANLNDLQNENLRSKRVESISKKLNKIYNKTIKI